MKDMAMLLIYWPSVGVVEWNLDKNIFFQGFSKLVKAVIFTRSCRIVKTVPGYWELRG